MKYGLNLQLRVRRGLINARDETIPTRLVTVSFCYWCWPVTRFSYNIMETQHLKEIMEKKKTSQLRDEKSPRSLHLQAWCACDTAVVMLRSRVLRAVQF